MASRPQLVLGTANRKKAQELIRLLDAVGLEITTLADFPEALSVAEEGDSFAANAAAKATEQARHLGRWVLAEDSGLAVDALDGAPGVFSARYSGPQATDESNNRKLLEALRDVDAERRTAGYVCHATLSDPSGKICAEIEAYCRGRILTEARGTHGFGYDPLFEVVEYHRSFGQFGPAVKGCLSHRGRAIRRLIPQLAALVDAGRWA